MTMTASDMPGASVLALVTAAFGGQGGIAQAERDMIEGLAAQPGVSAVAVLPRRASEGRMTSEKVRTIRPLPSRAGYVASALLTAGTVRPGLVFCSHLYMAPLAALVARLARAQMIVQLHGIEIWRPPSRVQRRALEASESILCVSRDTRARVLRQTNVAPERAVVLNNTVADRFHPGDRAAARARFGLAHEFTVVTVGRLDARERYKGHDLVLAAMAAMARSGGPVPLYLIAGDGDDRVRLEATAEATGLSDRVRFLGWIDDEELPDLYRAADLFALPSGGEGFGIAFLEAMACGCPAIGLAEGGAADALAEGRLGICVTSEEFPATFARLASAKDRLPRDFPARVQAAFGRQTFRSRLALHLQALRDAA